MDEVIPLDSKLCNICNEIDFASYFQPPVEGETSSENAIGQLLYKEKDLGSCAEIRSKKSQCAFCYFTSAVVTNVNAKATISMHSIIWGRNRDKKGEFMAEKYTLRILSIFQRRQAPHWIQLLADDAHLLGLSRDFLGRVPKDTKFDMAEACKWLELCRKEHGNQCNTLEGTFEYSTPPPQPIDLLVIDLVNMCICLMPQGAEYTALSYCWPAKAYFILLKNNRDVLFEHQALLERMSELPGTVQDAIKCAQELPFRYLWIDSLCIIQDDDDHKLKHLRQMDRVYSCASITLVSAYPVARGSSDPCSGLPGFNKHDQSRKRVFRCVKGLRMAVASPYVDEYLLGTRWDTRCWTFQERLLSCRLLYFTPIQVYFQCSCSVFCEDTICEDISTKAYVSPGHTVSNSKSRHMASETEGNWGRWELNRKPLEGLSNVCTSYELALSNYTYREVSYSSDILNAFEGIKVVLSDAMQSDFWQGIPERILAQALCWQLRGSFSRRRNRPIGGPPSEPLFPSWTWAGWESNVNLNDYMPIRTYRTDSEWYIVNKNSVATRLNVEPEWISLNSQRPSSAVIKAFLPRLIPRHEVDAMSEEWRDARILACWTTCASFVLDGSIHKLSENSHETLWPESVNFAIKDRFGGTGGSILLPKDHFESAGTNWLRCEFILLSRSIPLGLRFSTSYWDERVYNNKDWCHLNVMLISRLDDYTALRVGVGIVHKDAWIAAEPETTFVKLV
ncbi:heterokaryon incompatibility protein-domain-containing protein [Phaeosphaeriaceae sp. PMI808]|nr:heterokaryon incompatibility protein-domain-containing protein [Phaeosphaeriaceae sp. PMI808]